MLVASTKRDKKRKGEGRARKTQVQARTARRRLRREEDSTGESRVSGSRLVPCQVDVPRDSSFILFSVAGVEEKERARECVNQSSRRRVEGADRGQRDRVSSTRIVKAARGRHRSRQPTAIFLRNRGKNSLSKRGRRKEAHRTDPKRRKREKKKPHHDLFIHPTRTLPRSRAKHILGACCHVFVLYFILFYFILFDKFIYSSSPPSIHTENGLSICQTGRVCTLQPGPKKKRARYQGLSAHQGAQIWRNDDDRREKKLGGVTMATKKRRGDLHVPGQ